VLEIGTGSGYQAAVLSPLVKEVYTIEIVELLGKHAQQTLKRLKYANVFVKIGDGYQGWAEHAPFDKIIVTCSPEKVPQPLIDQLKEGGRMIIPVGERFQQVFHLLKKQDGKLINEALRPTFFVPMTGKAEEGREVQPDPLHPKLVNGSFEEVIAGNGEPVGWYYCRQMKVATGAGAPEGRNYATFTNTEPGRPSRALQSFAVDGRKIHELELSCFVKGTDIGRGIADNQLPLFAILFLDDNHATVGQVALGPFSGSFAWKRATRTVKVPAAAREGIVNLGLLGATGEISFDDVQIGVPKHEKQERSYR
jgi:protein-L-isoaspartate(D-aspartate) O-methyltransferase